MLSFISAKEAAEKWNISQRRVAILCTEERIKGAMMVGNMWIIPIDATKPEDARTSRYTKTEEKSVKPFLKWAGGKGQLLKEIEKYQFSKSTNSFFALSAFYKICGILFERKTIEFGRMMAQKYGFDILF